MFSRILANTKKQIQRSGWAGWGSISVMTLAMLVAIIFGGLAYFSNLWIQYIESRSNILVFFEVGIDEEIITKLQDKWELNPKIKSITYTTEEEAYGIYGDYSSKVQPIQYEVLSTNQFIDGKLPSSLDIQIYTLNDLKEVTDTVRTDIDAEVKALEITPADPANAVEYQFSQDPSVPPITLRVDSESLDKLREVLLTLRIAGIAVISLLSVVIFFFTFMTVEFKLYNQMEEIGVMQLVGGSLYFIRTPYIFEGAFYGFIGALISTFMIGSVFIATFVLNPTSAISVFLYENFSRLPWPQMTPISWAVVVLGVGLVGAFIGGFSTWFSIRRYIR
jgi:cell division transport system permease protein